MKIKQLKLKILLTLAYAIGILVLWKSGIGCIYRYLFDISCPGCGMTRAFLACLRLDFKAAFSFHPMIFAMPLLYLYFLFDAKIFGKKADMLIFILIAIGFLINYLSKFIVFC